MMKLKTVSYYKLPSRRGGYRWSIMEEEEEMPRRGNWWCTEEVVVGNVDRVA